MKDLWGKTKSLFIDGTNKVSHDGDEIEIYCVYDEECCNFLGLSEETKNALKNEKELTSFRFKVSIDFEGGYKGDPYQPPEEPLIFFNIISIDLNDSSLNEKQARELAQVIIDSGMLEYEVDCYVPG